MHECAKHGKTYLNGYLNHDCFFSSRRRHTRCLSDWSSDVCSSDLNTRVPRNPESTESRPAWPLPLWHPHPQNGIERTPSLRRGWCAQTTPAPWSRCPSGTDWLHPEMPAETEPGRSPLSESIAADPSSPLPVPPDRFRTLASTPVPLAFVRSGCSS